MADDNGIDEAEAGDEAESEWRELPSSDELLRSGSSAYVDREILDRYTVWDYRHAAAILRTEFPHEFSDLQSALSRFRLTDEQIRRPGGNESEIPRAISTLLRPRWKEVSLRARMMMDETEVQVSTHKIDYVRGRVAFDLEWNAKDQTFDRDLAAFRTFFEYGRISVGVLVTRDTSSLNARFKSLGIALKADGTPELKKNGQPRKIIEKYGASTTHIDKLLPRLRAGRSGGCPVLALGITSKLIEVAG